MLAVGEPSVGESMAEDIDRLVQEDDRVGLVESVSTDTATAKPREWTRRDMVIVVIMSSVAAFLQPIATTVYTPVLPVIQQDLGCSRSEIIATISVYLSILGFMPLVWGPFSDAYGRKRTILISCVIYCVTMLLCAFSWDVWALLVMRMLQAIGSSAGLTVGAGAIADTHPKNVRGRAMGYYLMGPLVGPIIGPSLGGIVAQFLGWRSIFIGLGILSAVVVVLVWYFMPETLPPPAPGEKRRMTNPLLVFKFLKYPGVLAVTAMAAWIYAGFYVTSFTMPIELSETYQQSPAITGLLLAPQGVCLMLGSTFGGRTADYFGGGGRPSDYRLISTTIGQLLFVPTFIAFGWLLRVNMAAVIAVNCVNGFFFTFPRPGISTYSIETVSKATGSNVSGAITGLQYSILYASGGISSQIAVPVIQSIGYGWFFTIMGVLALLFIAPVAYMMWRGIKQHRKDLRLNGPEYEIEMTPAPMSTAAQYKSAESTESQPLQIPSEQHEGITNIHNIIDDDDDDDGNQLLAGSR